MIKITTILALLLLPMRMLASEFLIQPITLDDGLSQCAARCVLHDNKGYLWIGTDFGLNRYDNNKVTSYYADDNDDGSIPDNEVVFLSLDASGDLLIGFGHGLARYNYSTNSFEQILCDGKPVDVRSACATPDGTIIGSYGKLYFYDSSTRTLRILPTRGGSTSAYASISPAWTPDCYMLLTHWEGLWLYDSSTGEISSSSICPERTLRAVVVDAARRLWVAPFDQGISCYDSSGRLLRHIDASNSALSSNIITDLAQYDGSLWVGTEQGIDIIDMSDFSVTNLGNRAYGPTNCTILCLSPDENGTIYAGTLRHGVMCISQVPMRTFNHLGNRHSYYGFTVTSLLSASDSKHVWVGIDGEGVALFDPIAETFAPVPATAGMKVTSIARFDANRIIIATYDKGLLLVDERTLQASPVPEAFKRIRELSANKMLSTELFNLSDGRIAAVTDVVCAISPASGDITEARFSGIRAAKGKLNPFFCNGKVLMLSDKRNLYRYDADADTCGVVFSAADGESITAADYDGDGVAWSATNRQLLRYDLRTRDSLSFNSNLMHNINALAIEGERLWIGADNRLYMARKGSDLTVFGASDGMSPNQFINKAQLLTPHYVLLGGVNGMLKINRSDIDRLVALTPSADIFLSGVTIDNSKATVTDGKVSVPNDHSLLTISIIDHDNTGFKNKLFRYTVYGFNRDLTIETFERSISLNMLPAGNYKVFVSYSLFNGEWSQPVELLRISVASPWWRSWWAILAYCIILAAAAFLLSSYFKAKRKRKYEQVKRDALIDKVNFLTRLHSDLRTPLTLILSPLNSLLDKQRKGAKVESDELAETLKEVYDNSLNMRDIIDTLPETHSLAEYMPNASPKPNPMEDDEQEEQDADSIVDAFDASPYTAFVVEANEKLRNLIVSHFQSVFKKVETASNAADAIFAIKASQPDIIIADGDLNGESGFELCSEVKSATALRHIPIIMLTSGNVLKQKRKSYAHGADSYISKPFEVDTLISRCKNLLLNRSNLRSRYDINSPAEAMASKAVSNSDESFLLQLDSLLAANITNPDFGVDFLAKKMALGRTAFYTRLRQITGKSIGQYVAEFRLRQAKEMLAHSSQPISDIADALGFNSLRYFSSFFKDKEGCTPSEYRAQNSQPK